MKPEDRLILQSTQGQPQIDELEWTQVSPTIWSGRGAVRPALRSDLPLLVLLRLGLRSLLLHKLRSRLSILGVVFGVAAVVAMSSVGEGARRETLAQIEALGIDTVTVRPRPPDARGEAPDRPAGAAADSVGRVVPGVRAVAPCAWPSCGGRRRADRGRSS